MPQYWEIRTTTPFQDGSDILNRQAKITFVVNPADGSTLDAQPTGTIFAWRTANTICFQTNYLVAPFTIPATPWVSGVIEIVTPNGVVRKQFMRATFVADNP